MKTKSANLVFWTALHDHWETFCSPLYWINISGNILKIWRNIKIPFPVCEKFSFTIATNRNHIIDFNKECTYQFNSFVSSNREQFIKASCADTYITTLFAPALLVHLALHVFTRVVNCTKREFQWQIYDAGLATNEFCKALDFISMRVSSDIK